MVAELVLDESTYTWGARGGQDHPSMSHLELLNLDPAFLEKSGYSAHLAVVQTCTLAWSAALAQQG